PVAATASRLSALSDGEIDQLLAPQLPATADRSDAIAWLRRTSSFAVTPGGVFGEARRLLAALPPAAQEKRHELAVAAYLDGIEPHEASLRARDPELATRIEGAFLDLRKTIDGRATDAALQQNIAAINLLLDRATERRTGPQVAFVAA